MHSGDSAQVLPPHSLGPEMLAELRAQTAGIALGLGVVGLINVQYAITRRPLYVIEANPRASRTVPFVSKAVGVPLAKMACRLMLGEKIADLGLPEDPMAGDHVSVKEAVLPFDRFKDADAVLGPGDALDRRGHGHRPRLPDRVRQGPGRGRRGAADRRDGLPHGDRLRQGRRSTRSPRRSTTSASGSSPRAAPPRRSARWACPCEAHQQDRRGLAARRRLDRARRRRPRRQHADRLGRALGRLGDPPRRGRRRRALHHDDLRRRRRGAGDRARPPARPRRGALAPGAPRRAGARPATAREPPRWRAVARAPGLRLLPAPSRAHRVAPATAHRARLRAAARSCRRAAARRRRATPCCASRRSA